MAGREKVRKRIANPAHESLDLDAIQRIAKRSGVSPASVTLVLLALLDEVPA